MGNAVVKGDPVSKQIDKDLAKSSMKDAQVVKILLLGPGESGKSTVVKQMRIIHLNGFTDEERKSFVRSIRDNVLLNTRSLVDALTKFGLSLPDDLQAMAKELAELPPEGLDAAAAAKIKAIWANDLIQEAFGRRHEFYLTDGAEHFFGRVDEVADPDYMPTEQDLLFARVRTTGVVQIPFEVQGVPFNMVDVGGQRSERRKWIHCFDDVHAILFVAAISEYDQVLVEDRRTNRMVDCLTLFEEVCNMQCFAESAVMLFLNKSDLFEKKIKRVDLKVCFPDYGGGCDYDNALEYLRAKFDSLNHQEQRMYVHVTCATNTDNIRFVFEAMRDSLLSLSLQDAGF